MHATGVVAHVSTGPIITHRAARQVLASVWAKRERDRSIDELQALAGVDVGPELQLDSGVALEARDAGWWSRRVERPLGPSVVVVPYETDYPASFLAIVETTSQWSRSERSHVPRGHEVALLVFTKTGSAAPWRVAMETRYNGSLTHDPYDIDLRTQTAGAFAPPAPQRAWMPGADAVESLASYYEEYAEEGENRFNVLFAPGYWTTGQGKRIAASGIQGVPNAHGFRNWVKYDVSVAADGVYQFDVAGQNLTCGTVRGTALDLPDPYGYLYQPRSRTSWGGWIAPGAYSEIRASLMHQVCLVIPPAREDQIVAFSGDSAAENVWAATATPLPLRPTAPKPIQGA